MTLHTSDRPGVRWSRMLSGLCAMVLLATSLSGCIDDEPTEQASAPRPTRVRPTSAPREPGAKADWTVLVYLDGDNDLEEDAIGDFNEMASVGSNDRLNIVVQFDRVSSDEDWDDDAYGDWDSVKRFRVAPRKRPVASNELEDLGELNMGDPATVVDFATWGIKTYPADHYALIFWDHGASWPGIASDDSSDGDLLTLPELSEALAEVQQATGVDKLDLIGFDACLMGQIDVLQSVAPYGEVAIGSADLEPGEGWAWNAWLRDLTTNPPDSAAELAPSIIDSFMEFYDEEGDSSVTLAAFDLNQVERMTSQLDTLSSAMIETMPNSFKAIGKARAHAAEYAGGDADVSAIDLGHFAQSLAAAKTDRSVTRAARALAKTIEEARIDHGYGDDHPEATGISVYFPWKRKNYDADYRKNSPLTEATSWDEFLLAFYKAGRSQKTRSAVSEPELVSNMVSAEEPLDLSATITGDDTAYVYYYVGAVPPESPDTVQIMRMDYIYPPGVTLDGAIPNWADGDEVQLSWNSSAWYLSNGSEVVQVPLSPLDYGANTYSVEGTYTARKSGKQTPVSIEFEINQRQGVLTHIWAFDKANSDNPRPRELQPKAGDSFTPDIWAYTEQDEQEAEELTIAGTPITFGDQPLTTFEAAAPAGDYVIGLMVENISGDIADQYADVTVDNPIGDALPDIPAPPAAPEEGAVAGTLAFYDEQLGFAMDYPANWEFEAPGADKVVFFDASDDEGAYLAVDAYALDGEPADSNQAILEELLAIDQEQVNFELVTEISELRAVNRSALRVEYTYQDDEGASFQVVAVAVSDKTTDATYLLTFDAPEERFADELAIFEEMLESMRID